MHVLFIALQCSRCALNGRRYYSKNPLLKCQIHGGLYLAMFESFFIATWCLSFKPFKEMSAVLGDKAK